MIEDTKYVIDSDIQPHDKLHKSRTELYFHWVCEDIAFKMVAFYHVYWGDNPSIKALDLYQF